VYPSTGDPLRPAILVHCSLPHSAGKAWPAVGKSGGAFLCEIGDPWCARTNSAFCFEFLVTAVSREVVPVFCSRDRAGRRPQGGAWLFLSTLKPVGPRLIQPALRWRRDKRKAMIQRARAPGVRPQGRGSAIVTELRTSPPGAERPRSIPAPGLRCRVRFGTGRAPAPGSRCGLRSLGAGSILATNQPQKKARGPRSRQPSFVKAGEGRRLGRGLIHLPALFFPRGTPAKSLPR